ncbi:hypothetical protein KCU77_g9934, partial [Aureobasidium melanogenum]
MSDSTSYDDSTPRRLVREAFQSFPFLPGYQNISFEEQRLNDTSPMATGKVGRFSPSALESLRAADPGHENPKDRDSSLLDWGSNFVHELNPRKGSVESHLEPENEHVHDAKTEPTIEKRLDVDVAAFRLYTEWVYSGRIQKEALEVNAVDIDLSSIGQAYILGEKLQDLKFKNAVINLLLQTIITQGKMDLTLPTLVFKETSASAPLRRLLVDLYVWYGYKDWLKSNGSKESISSTFLSDLSAAFFDRHGHDGVTKAKALALDPCNYHEHPDGKLCSIGKCHPREIAEPNQNHRGFL